MQAPDRVDAARHALGEIMTHPATWAPFLPAAGAYAFLGVPWWLCLPLMLACLVVVLVAWSRRWPRLMEQAHTKLLTDYRSTENVALGERVRRIARSAGKSPAAPSAHLLESLRQALEIKQAVENRLFADGLITPHEEEIDTMVAELVCTMVQEAERQTVEEGSTPRQQQAAESFERAATTLRRAFAELEVMLDPVPESLRLPAENDALARASERLDEKLVQARGVRRHLEQGMIIPDSAPTAPASASDRPADPQPAAEG